ncbi:MAG: bifunctional serine/threonine-protein kinase/formylglycine-generating enzyme family protein [Polyangiaceae bacterium]
MKSEAERDEEVDPGATRGGAADAHDSFTTVTRGRPGADPAEFATLDPTGPSSPSPFTHTGPSNRDPRSAASSQDADSLAPDAWIGERIGRYRVVERIGRGGMGVVFRAVHEEIGQVAAVKLLSAKGSVDASYHRRFIHEARAASRVHHPGLVKIFDFGQMDSGVPFLLMEYLDGELLRRRIKAGPIDALTAAHVVRQAASALAALHEAGIVHRDLKPENMMLVRDDEAPTGERVKLLDFGIARLGEATLDDAGEGLVIGTGAYMSPEQCVGETDIDGRADMYSLGVVLYEMLAGEPPFRGAFAELLHKHVHEEPRPLQRAAKGAPESLIRLAHRLLSKEPTLRPTAAEVIDLLRRADSGSPPDSGSRQAPSAAEMATRPERSVAPVAKPDAPATQLEAPAKLPVWKRRAWQFTFGVSVAIALGSAAFTLRRSPPPAPAVTLKGMVHLPGGAYRMGSTAAEIDAECARLGPDCRRDLIEREQPARDVTLSPFHIDEHEVQNIEFATWLRNIRQMLEVHPDDESHEDRWVRERDKGLLLMDLYPGECGVAYRDKQFSARPGFEHRPVVQVTWDGARLYCAARGKRLPTEAEWEYAARGAARRRFPWGDEAPRCDGVFFGRTAKAPCSSLPRGAHDVGTAPQDRTPEGVFDLGGNVGEWVEDQFLLAHYPSCGTCVDPKVEEAGTPAEDLRVFRGGSWESTEISSRAATRSRWKRNEVMTGLGFRCVSR